MKRFSIAGAALISVLTAGSAFAADLPVYTKAPPVPVFTWNGAYIGVNLGYSNGRETTDGTVTTTTTPPGTTTTAPLYGSATLDGFVGGGQFGYNWQFGNWLVGLEGDLQGTTEAKTGGVCTVPGCPAGSLVTSIDYRLKWFGTDRVRIGGLIGERVLLYATGGLAYGSFTGEEGTQNVNTPAGALQFGTWSKVKAGWTVGAGVEAAIDYNWSVKFEYLYMDLGNVGGATASTTVITPVAGAPSITTVTNYAFGSKFTDNIVRVGFNYRFNPAPAAVVAKY